jgi:hypothetical protein
MVLLAVLTVARIQGTPGGAASVQPGVMAVTVKLPTPPLALTVAGVELGRPA